MKAKFGLANVICQPSIEVSFSYLSLPTFGDILPTTGASVGGTHAVINGSNLRGGSDYRVAFGDSVVAATYRHEDRRDILRSVTAPTNASSSTVRITTNGILFDRIAFPNKA